MPREQISRQISRKEQLMDSSPSGPKACRPSLQESLSEVKQDAGLPQILHGSVSNVVEHNARDAPEKMGDEGVG
jgi:hypothetical protein